MLDGDSIKRTFCMAYNFILFYKNFSVPEQSTIFGRSGTIGKQLGINQTALSQGSTYAPNTFYDKGLFDNRELGYIY